MPNFFLAGRVGAFKYMAVDECMEDAANLVTKIKDKSSAWPYGENEHGRFN